MPILGEPENDPMRAPGFFDLEERFVKLDELGDPLKKIAGPVNREGFRAAPSDASSKPRRSKAGRKRGAKSPHSSIGRDGAEHPARRTPRRTCLQGDA